MAEAVRRGTLEAVSHVPGQDAHVEGVLLNVDQVAKRLGTPTRFVRRLIAERRIGFCRIGRYVRVTDSDVTAFIEAGHVPPATMPSHMAVQDVGADEPGGRSRLTSAARQ